MSLSLRLPDDLVARLSHEAAARGLTKSEIVRRAVSEYLDSHGRSPASVAALAGDLIGCLEGPEDLSHNPKHLEGFGR